jgi:hypothetical protein
VSVFGGFIRAATDIPLGTVNKILWQPAAEHRYAGRAGCDGARRGIVSVHSS